MSSWARVGAKVICVSLPPEGCEGEIDPIVGASYTVRGADFDEFGSCGIYLSEIVNPAVETIDGIQERAYRVKYFRPLVSQEDDISMFKSLLKPTEVPA